jgi:sulfate-transporting ATPase
VRASAGEIRVNGEQIDRLPTHRRVRAGVGRSFQSLELFEQSTLRKNLRVASDPHDLRSYGDVVIPAGGRCRPARSQP